jgi:hypothetical protein
MAAVLTEKIVVLLSPDQKAAAEEKAAEVGSVGAVVRQALTLFLTPELSASEQTASKQTINS